MSAAAKEFLRSAAVKSADIAHRETIRRSINTYLQAVERGRARFLDWQAARQRCHEIKWEALNHLDRCLLEFEDRVKARGGHVFWAENGEEARLYITELAKRHGVRKIVKSKSMVAEEIHLRPALERQGIEVFETDLGEFIVQLRSEPPYHIVTPAMHLTRSDIAALFRSELGGAGISVDSDDPEQLVAAARQTMRRAFLSAEMGITGANFLVADTGMIAITTNEGNADLGISLPRIHVALAGIEKIVPRLEDLALLWPMLSTSGTGQPLTVYNTLVGSSRGPGEVDGPEEFHVVLVDNGRSELLADAEQRDVLHCIRCGACLNACPIFRSVGGHAYGTTYQGPIGSVLTPHLEGLNEYQHLSFASSLCGACTEVCPVKIDLHHHLLHNRRNAVSAAEREHSGRDPVHRPWTERLGFKLSLWAMISPSRFAFVGWIGRVLLRAAYGIGLEGTAVDPLKSWTRHRAAPRIPARSFRALWRDSNGNL